MSLIHDAEYKNINGDRLQFKHIPPFQLIDWSGVGQPETNLSTTKQYGLAGEQLLSKSINFRDIEFIVLIKSPNYSHSELLTLKRDVISIMNPMLSGTITISSNGRRYEIDVEVMKGIDDADTNTATSHRAILQWRALDPYWRDVTNYDHLVPLSVAQERLIFPLAITKNYVFSTVIAGEIVNVENNGDAPVGMTLTFSFYSVVTNPKVIKIHNDGTSNEFLGFNGTYEPGDKIVVSTLRNKKSMTFYPKDGEPKNAMSRRIIGTTFLELDNGVSTPLRTDATSGGDGMYVEMSFTPLVLGV